MLSNYKTTLSSFMQECKKSSKCFTIQILMTLHIKISTNDSFLIKHFGSSKNKNKTLKSKKHNECFTMQIPIKMHTKNLPNTSYLTDTFS